MPPAPAIPCAQNPAASQKPADVRLAQDELVVRREGLGAVDDPAHARIGHGGHASDRAFHDRLEAGQIRPQQLAVEIRRDAVEAPRVRVALVAAHAQPADLLAEVDEVVRVAQLGEGRFDALDRFGEQVLMRHRDDRHGHTDQPPDLGGEHAAGVHDDVGRDLAARTAVLDGHPGDTPTLDPDPDDARLGPDRHASLACAGGERLRETGRIEPAVGR